MDFDKTYASYLTLHLQYNYAKAKSKNGQRKNIYLFPPAVSHLIWITNPVKMDRREKRQNKNELSV